MSNQVTIDVSGWYFISSSTTQSVLDTVNGLRQNSTDTVSLYQNAYYYDEGLASEQ